MHFRWVKQVQSRSWIFTINCYSNSGSSNGGRNNLYILLYLYTQWKLFKRGKKGELEPEISLLHMRVLTLIKAKSNVFLWYLHCCSCTRRSKTKILTTSTPTSWIEFDVVTSQRQTQRASNCVMLLESITWDSQTIFLVFICSQRLNCEARRSTWSSRKEY